MEFEMTVLEKWQVNSLTIVHCVLTIFMNEHELTGEGKVAPILVFIDARHSVVGIEECWASVPLHTLLTYDLDQSQQHQESSKLE